MVIKFQDEFDSIFYSVLLSNLTGHYLVSKNQDEGLFRDEPHIDINSLDWRQILEEHNERYGSIHWMNDDYELEKFRKEIEQMLKSKKPSKYKKIAETIRGAIKFGFNYCFQ
ncbi:MAG: hypothetical protein PHC97_02225 [Patescibacteria group bacterium]|nr:hypothetical protein [Patescibacteria group bacterium]